MCRVKTAKRKLVLLKGRTNHVEIDKKRILGEYGECKDGTLFVVVAAIHGNEQAAVKALDLVFKMIEVEPITNPDFELNGKIVGIVGNHAARQLNRRYIDTDMNRIWTEDIVEEVTHPDFKLDEDSNMEYLEMREFLFTLEYLARSSQAKKMVILDLHTTSAKGGIFSICPDNSPVSLNLAYTFHAPVLLGFLEGIKGTLMHYFQHNRFDTETSILTFESGQHTEKLSVNRAIAAIMNSLKHLGMIESKHIEHQHEKQLINYAKDLPKTARLITHHSVNSSDKFRMMEGFSNFQSIKKGQLLAHDVNGPIYAPTDGLILMPLYQRQGADGFFVVEALEDA